MAAFGFNGASRFAGWPSILALQPLTAENMGAKLPLNKYGPENNREMAMLLEKNNIHAKDPNFMSDQDQNRRQLDNLDLREQYNKRAVPLNLIPAMTAAQLNSSNSYVYTYLVPLMPTDEFNFTISTFEIYQAPFDEMSPLNIARETGYERQMRAESLTFYKRSASAEYNLLNDKIFGPQTLEIMKEQLTQHTQLTFMTLGINAIVEIPYYMELKRLNQPWVGISHSREYLNRSHMIFSGADLDSSLLRRIKFDADDRNKINAVIMPKGAGDMILKNVGEPRVVDGYIPFLQSSTGKMLMEIYDSGQKTFTSLPHGNGATLDFFEFWPMKGYSHDSDERAFNPLTSSVLLSEALVMPRIRLDDLASPQASTTGKMLDIVGIEQTPNHLHKEVILFREYLKANPLFMGADGEPLWDPHAGLSHYVHRIAARYNESDTTRTEFFEAFHTLEHLDNNAPATRYLRDQTPLTGMTGFRHFFPFLAYAQTQGGPANFRTHQVIVPQYVGDVALKTLQPSYLWQCARVMSRHLDLENVSPVGLGAQGMDEVDLDEQAIIRTTNVVDNANRIVALQFAYTTVDRELSVAGVTWAALERAMNVLAADGTIVPHPTVVTYVQGLERRYGARVLGGGGALTAADVLAEKQHALQEFNAALRRVPNPVSALAQTRKTVRFNAKLHAQYTKLASFLPNSSLIGRVEAAGVTLPQQIAALNHVLNPDAFGARRLPVATTAERATANKLLGSRRFSVPAGTHLAPRMGESKAAYLGRVTSAALHEDAESDSFTSETAGWLALLQHVPKEALGHFLGLVYATHKDGREATELDDAQLSDFVDRLVPHSLHGHVTANLKGAVAVAEEQEANQGLSVGEALEDRGPDLKYYKVSEARKWASQGALPALVPSLSDRLADMGVNLGAPGTGTGRLRPVAYDGDQLSNEHTLAERQEHHSWQGHTSWYDRHKNESQAIRLAYIFLLQSPFNLFTCDKLAQFGIALFRQNYLRLQIDIMTDSLVALQAGPNNMVLAVGHPDVKTGTDAPVAHLSWHASFFAGVLNINANTRTKIYLHALPNMFKSGRSMVPIRKPEDLSLWNSRDRPSILVCPTPVNEDVLEWPMSLDRSEIYTGPNTQAPLATRKTSMTDLVQEFVGLDEWTDFETNNDFFAQYYHGSQQLCMQIERGYVGVPITNNPEDRQWRMQAGTGALGVPARNADDADKAWQKQGPFPGRDEPIWVG